MLLWKKMRLHEEIVLAVVPEVVVDQDAPEVILHHLEGVTLARLEDHTRVHLEDLVHDLESFLGSLLQGQKNYKTFVC